jgi:hypothetical protein
MKHEMTGQVPDAIAYIANAEIPEWKNIRARIISLVGVGVNSKGTQKSVATFSRNSGQILRISVCASCNGKDKSYEGKFHHSYS